MLRNYKAAAEDETCKFNIRKNYVYYLARPNTGKHDKEKLCNSHLEEEIKYQIQLE